MIHSEQTVQVCTCTTGDSLTQGAGTHTLGTCAHARRPAQPTEGTCRPSMCPFGGQPSSQTPAREPAGPGGCPGRGLRACSLRAADGGDHGQRRAHGAPRLEFVGAGAKTSHNPPRATLGLAAGPWVTRVPLGRAWAVGRREPQRCRVGGSQCSPQGGRTGSLLKPKSQNKQKNASMFPWGERVNRLRTGRGVPGKQPP